MYPIYLKFFFNCYSGRKFEFLLKKKKAFNYNSLSQNIVVGSLFLFQGIFQTQGSNPGLLHCRWILYQLSHKRNPGLLGGQPISSPADLPEPGVELGSRALQADSLPTELSEKPQLQSQFYSNIIISFIISFRFSICDINIHSLIFLRLHPHILKKISNAIQKSIKIILLHNILETLFIYIYVYICFVLLENLFL